MNKARGTVGLSIVLESCISAALRRFGDVFLCRTVLTPKTLTLCNQVACDRPAITCEWSATGLGRARQGITSPLAALGNLRKSGLGLLVPDGGLASSIDLKLFARKRKQADVQARRVTRRLAAMAPAPHETALHPASQCLPSPFPAAPQVPPACLPHPMLRRSRAVSRDETEAEWQLQQMTMLQSVCLPAAANAYHASALAAAG